MGLTLSPVFLVDRQTFRLAPRPSRRETLSADAVYGCLPGLLQGLLPSIGGPHIPAEAGVAGSSLFLHMGRFEHETVVLAWMRPMFISRLEWRPTGIGVAEDDGLDLHELFCPAESLLG
jgi:hypothetical protein